MAPSFVFTLGGINMDIVGRTTHSPTAGDSTPGSIHCAPGGVARNVAENLARLGHIARLLSAVGDDAMGHALLQATRLAGVDVSACRVLPGESTSTYLALHGADGDLSAALNDMRILEHIGPAWLSGQAQQLGQARAWVVDCNLGEAALEWVFSHCGEVPVFVDTVSAFKCLRVQPWLSRVHLLKPNRLEATALSGLPLHSPSDAPAVAAWFHGRGVRQVVLSLGAQGVYWSDSRAGCGLQAAPQARVVNANGAGDALTAGLVHGWLMALPLAQALRFGMACAALTLGTELANHPQLTLAAVEQWLDRQGT